MSTDIPTHERQERSTISSRIFVLRAFRTLMETPEFRQTWKPMKLGREMWELTPELRQQYGGVWDRFWDMNQRRLPHIMDGDYDKLDDERLHLGLRRFLERNFPDALGKPERASRATVIDIAAGLDGFLGETRVTEVHVPTGEEPAVYGVENGLHTPERHRNCFMSWRRVEGSNQCPAVMFSTTNALLRFEGFLLPRTGIAVLRGVDRAGEFVLAVLEHSSNDRSSMACRIVHRAFAMARFSPLVSVFPTLDQEARKTASDLLNFLDRITVDA